MRIKNFCRFTTAVFFTAICGSGAASDVLCERVAQETLMELKAGAADWWTEDTARMAGMAAASACFKTQAMLTHAPVTPDQSDADFTEDEESTEFMGLQVKPLSGPPSRKPYERTRD
jgi:hypothetical protein